MTIERGDKVIAIREIGDIFSSEYVPKGTTGVGPKRTTGSSAPATRWRSPSNA
ncbi:hypothetical protein [Kribbella sp. NPDC051137]|uniref:hypothetical protein n=1 Tax=Kribbella sp. NPDC051137 TaxID=3155045 RepID=UPI003417C5B3